MSLLIELLDKYIFSGVPSNAAYDLIKAAWAKTHEKPWDLLYIQAFKQAVRETQPILAKYTNVEGQVGLDEAALLQALHHDLAIDLAGRSLSDLSDTDFAKQLGRAMARRSVLILGGHNLSPIDYAQLVYNLVQQSRAYFKAAILDNEHSFREALLSESQVMQTRLRGTQALILDSQALVRDVQSYLTNQFNLLLSRLDEMAGDIKEIRHVLTEHPPTLHFADNIPMPPALYIAHPYALLQTHKLIGRQSELDLLTAWVTNSQPELQSAHILSIIAIGGTGKSALTWNWFNEIASRAVEKLTGQMWWSFYESNATFENFVIHALAYTTGRPREEVKKLSASEREAQLFTVLDRNPFLLVLDGLERILVAYAQTDAAQMGDSGIPSDRQARRTLDLRAGPFLRKLTLVKSSRLLVSSRLYPVDLETEIGKPVPGSYRYDLSGLSDEDAMELWQAFDITGLRDQVLPIFARFSNHPLLIQVLAGQVKRFRPAPGNFAAWYKANWSFDLTQFERLQDIMEGILKYVLRRLNVRARKVLNTLAAFRIPTTYNTIASLLVRGYFVPDWSQSWNAAQEFRFWDFDKLLSGLSDENSTFANEQDLDTALTELENRGLLGWDRQYDRYDLHPIVRNVVWSRLSAKTRKKIQAARINYYKYYHFAGQMEIWKLSDLTVEVEFYDALIDLDLYNTACDWFYGYLDKETVELNTGSLRVELLQKLFPDGLERLPRLRNPNDQAWTLHALARGYEFAGRLKEAIATYQRHISFRQKQRDSWSVCISSANLAGALHLAGKLRESEFAARRALSVLPYRTHVKRKDSDGDS